MSRKIALLALAFSLGSLVLGVLLLGLSFAPGFTAGFQTEALTRLVTPWRIATTILMIFGAIGISVAVDEIIL